MTFQTYFTFFSEKHVLPGTERSLALFWRVVERLIIGDGPVKRLSGDHLVLPLEAINVHCQRTAGAVASYPAMACTGVCTHGGVYRGCTTAGVLLPFTAVYRRLPLFPDFSDVS